jgi:predicted nicotinamide N-methyase
MAQTLGERIRSFPRWHYQFTVAGETTPVYDPTLVNRHRQRKRYFFDPLVKLCGGSLKGKRVLDLGCNAGFWSLCAIEAGCDQVVGIDGRAMHVEQANLIFEASGVALHRYSFLHANLFDMPELDLGTFDIVLCLGLFYHVCRHMTLLEWIAQRNTDLLVIDTVLSTLPGSAMQVNHEPLDDPRNSCDRELVMVPTRQAVHDLVGQVGYRAVTLAPDFTDDEGVEEFGRGERRAFVCSRRTPLVGLPAEEEPPAGVLHPDPETLGGRRLLRLLWRRCLRRLSGT